MINGLDVSATISGTWVTNITRNRYEVYYDPDDAANSYLNGETYSLVNGGYLAPEGTTDIETGSTELPTEWELEQNYPNPFNPTTNIGFHVPESAQIRLEIYSLLGQKICTLLNGPLSAGYHNFSWDALDQAGNQVASGTYIYMLKSENIAMSKRMALLL